VADARACSLTSRIYMFLSLVKCVPIAGTLINETLVLPAMFLADKRSHTLSARTVPKRTH
jgi:hypothetical protein